MLEIERKMNKIIHILFLIILNTNINAEILECRVVDNIKIGIQFAKYKFEELRSTNGTIYTRGGYNSKYNYTIFTAITKLGIENVVLFNESKYVEGITMYKIITNTEFKNGMNKEVELLCYNLIEMNKKRVREGNKPSEITVSDY
jgi:hypothetical protein